MLTIDIDKVDGVAIVKCVGRLLRGEAVNTLRNAVLSEQNTRIIVLDLSDVEAADAGGLNAVVSLRNWAVSRGIRVKLVNPSPLVSEMLTRFRLDRVLEISLFHDALVVLAGCDCTEAAAAAC
ncbi:MAG: STAS domain-containing protein [Terriglobales bacterium]